MFVRYDRHNRFAGSTGRVGRAQRDEKYLCPLTVRITAALYDELTAKLKSYAAKDAQKVRDNRKNSKLYRPCRRKHIKKFISKTMLGSFFNDLSRILSHCKYAICHPSVPKHNHVLHQIQQRRLLYSCMCYK